MKVKRGDLKRLRQEAREDLAVVRGHTDECREAHILEAYCCLSSELLSGKLCLILTQVIEIFSPLGIWLGIFRLSLNKYSHYRHLVADIFHRKIKTAKASDDNSKYTGKRRMSSGIHKVYTSDEKLSANPGLADASHCLRYPRIFAAEIHS